MVIYRYNYYMITVTQIQWHDVYIHAEGAFNRWSEMLLKWWRCAWGDLTVKKNHDTSVKYSILGLTLSYPQFDRCSGINISVVLGRSAFIHRQRLRGNYWYIFPSSPQAWELGQWGLLIEPIINVWRTVKGSCFTINSSDTHCEFWWSFWMNETSVT